MIDIYAALIREVEDKKIPVPNQTVYAGAVELICFVEKFAPTKWALIDLLTATVERWQDIYGIDDRQASPQA